MVYATIPILAILIQAIINQDVLFRKNEKDSIPAQKQYIRFLLTTMIFYVADAAWGILNEHHLTVALYADTVIYYLVMAGAVLMWTRYVIGYLGENNAFSDYLMYAGQVFYGFEIVCIVTNFFHPFFFYFDEAGDYHAGFVRYLALCIQILLFLLASVQTFLLASKSEGAVRRRNNTVGLFGVAMIIFIGIQYFFPLLPIYTMGYLLGCCLLHAFVVEDVKDEYRRELEEALSRERDHKRELGSAKRLAYTDPLTGVKNKHAYIEKEEEIDRMIYDKVAERFGVVVFDLNGLKKVNDTKGHDIGDEYIVSACKLICDFFKHSPVYRIGGDEFVVILDGDDYKNRAGILGAFDLKIEKNLKTDNVVIATGMSEYDPQRDNCFRNVFERADSIMYQRKRILKHMVVA